jgi:hypothetical protein
MSHLNSTQKEFVKLYSHLPRQEAGVFHDHTMKARRSGRTEAIIECINTIKSGDTTWLGLDIVVYTPRLDAPTRFAERGLHDVQVICVDPETVQRYDTHADVTFVHNLPVRPCTDGGRILYVGAQ